MNLARDTYVGWNIFVGPKPEQHEIPWDSGCYGAATFKKIKKTDLIVGKNEIKTTLARPNNNGNFGDWGAGLWKRKADPSDTTPSDCESLGSGTYSAPPQTFSWNLTQAQYDGLSDS